MANLKKRVAENVPGDFFVDSTCIDCDACRQIAPAVFGEAAETSFVKAQPVSGADRRQALQALLACPTGSIGCLGDDDVKAVMKDFPLVIEEPVFYCGYNSPKSYGGNSYFIRHPAGNWLIDSPKFVTPLVRRLEALGGIAHIFLTHRDDVADAGRYAEHFGAGASFTETSCRRSPVRKSSSTATGRGSWRPAFSPSRRRATRRGIASCCSRTASSSPAITWTGTGTSSSFRPPRITAGIRGRSRPSRWGGWRIIASSGCCPATARRCICLRTRCERKSCAWPRR